MIPELEKSHFSCVTPQLLEVGAVPDREDPLDPVFVVGKKNWRQSSSVPSILRYFPGSLLRSYLMGYTEGNDIARLFKVK